MVKPIFLIGLMGAGKSTLAQYISKNSLSHSNCIDTDEVISYNNSMSVSDMFTLKGEDYFRKCEHELLIQTDFLNSVVATGGGFPCYSGNIDLMLQKGWVIFLDISPSEIVERIWNQKESRPLLNSIESKHQLVKELERLNEARKTCYQKAHFTISSVESLEEIHQKIVKICFES